MNRAALAWGAVGTLVVLVARQTMTLLGVESRPAWPLVLGAALLVGVLVAVVASAVESRAA